MTDIDDYSSPYDDADEARAEEPPDGYYDREPIDLDEVAKAYHEALGEDMSGLGENSKLALAAVPELVAELRQTRERLAEREALPWEIEYVVAVGGDEHPERCDLLLPVQNAEEAEKAADGYPLPKTATERAAAP